MGLKSSMSIYILTLFKTIPLLSLISISLIVNVDKSKPLMDGINATLFQRLNVFYFVFSGRISERYGLK